MQAARLDVLDVSHKFVFGGGDALYPRDSEGPKPWATPGETATATIAASRC